MSHSEARGVDSDGDEVIVWSVVRPGLGGAAVASELSRFLPENASTRSLQAAAEPENYNLNAFPILTKHGERIQYERENITLSEAREDQDLAGKVTSDDEFDFEDDDILFVKHSWTIPDDLPELR